MTIEYGAPPPPTVTRHDHIYTTLLGVLTFLLLFGMTTLYWINQQSTPGSPGKRVLTMVLAEEAMFFVAMVAVVLVRLCLPKFRRWPTFGLNILMLLFFPFGTALAIYGFWKVDKKLPRSPEA